MPTSESIKPRESSFQNICIPIKVIDNSEHFIGREPELERFVADLHTFSKGAFLVTGYKGVGKTRFVQEAIKKLTDHEDLTVIHISISLGNGSIEIKDVLDDLHYQLRSNLEIPQIIKLSIHQLRKQMRSSESQHSESLNAGCQLLGLKSFVPGLKLTGKEENSEKIKNEPASVRALETQLINLINIINEPKRIEKSDWFTEIKQRLEKNDDNTDDQKEIHKKIVEQLEENGRQKYKLIFTFDELDKVELHLSSPEQNKEKKRRLEVDRLLSSMKRLFSESNATFIFIAGRNILDMYHGEIGNTEALYEHLFKQIYYVPSLLRDQTIGKRSRLSRMVEEYVYFRITGEKSYIEKNSKVPQRNYKNISPFHFLMSDELNVPIEEKKEKLELTEEVKNAILILRNFSNFLTFHSWGNFDILEKNFSSFLRVRSTKTSLDDLHDPLKLFKKYSPVKSTGTKIHHAREIRHQEGYYYYLEFDAEAYHRIMTASNLYTLFYQGLGRQLNIADDRLVVSSFILYHHILKLHKFGFSKKHVERAAQAISGSGLSQLSVVGETIINSVLYPFIRATFGGLHQYRYFHSFEMQLSYLTNNDATDTATFNFSTEIHTDVRIHYENLYKRYEKELGHGIDKSGVMTKAKIQEILGDFSMWDKRHDEAFIYYGGADTTLNENEHPEEMNFANLQFSIQTLIKLGSLQEMRGDYSLAESFYLQVEKVVTEALEKKFSPHLVEQIEKFPDKFHVLRNAFLARIYLNAKRHTSTPFDVQLLPQNIASVLFKKAPYISFKIGVANYFSHNFERALIQFHRAYNQSNINDDYQRAIAGIKIAQTFIIIRLNNISTDRSIEDIETTIPVLKRTERKLIDALVDSLEPKNNQLSFEEVVNSQESELLENVKKCSFLSVLDFLLIQQKRLKKLGLHSQSARVLLVHTSICVLVLESIPWRALTKKNARKLKSICTLLKKKVSGTYYEVKQANLRSYQSAFAMFRTSFYKEYLCDNSSESLINSIPYSVEDDDTMLKLGNLPHIEWQFSPVGEIFLMMRLWFVRAGQAVDIIADNERSINLKNIDQRKVLPQSSWAYAVSLWMSGRNLVKVITQLNSELSSDEIFNKSKMALQYLSQSVNYFRQLSDNDRNIIVPSVSQVTYNIWELLYFLVEKRLNENTDELYGQAVNYVQNELRPEELGIRSTSFLNLDYAFQTTIHYLDDVIGFNETQSNVRRDVLRNKHFINDDFEDPSFGMFWMYFCGFNNGAKLHWIEIRRAMLDIYDKNKKLNSSNANNGSRGNG